MKTPLLKFLAISSATLFIGCNASRENDEALTDYAETFNNQAFQLIPLTPAITGFNAHVAGDTFYIDVAMDTTIVKPAGLTEENVKQMLKESLTTQDSGDLGFAETLEATGVKLRYRCIAGTTPIVNCVMEPSELKK